MGIFNMACLSALHSLPVFLSQPKEKCTLVVEPGFCDFALVLVWD